MTDPVPTPAPALPDTGELVERFHQIAADLAKVEAMRMELAAIDARLHERGINPHTYTPGPGHSNTLDHAQPAEAPE